MLSRKMAAVVFGAAFLAVTATASLHGANWNKAHYLTFSRSVALPGVQLAAGTYLFELALPESEQTLVRVMSRERRHVYLTAFTNKVGRPHNLRPDQMIIFGESSRGMAPPIRIWYPPDGGDGREFIYK